MKYTCCLLFVFCISILKAQHPDQPIFCGNDIFSDIIRTHYQDLGRAFTETFKMANQSFLRTTEALNVRVVVHVVWNAPEENLHDSIIQNQIQVLNEDYNRLNPDTSNLRSIFWNEAGRANIHFELEEVVRVHTDQLFAVDLLGTNLLAEAKHTEEGGSDAWDPASFLNIWIIKIQPIEIFGVVVGQILGFAFPPNGLDNWPDGVAAPSPEEDGVVLDYRIIGRNNPNTIENPDGSGTLLTVRGRSASHEVGHYLGLRHIWGDGGLLGPNDCMQSDGIEDTPFADSQSAFDCDKEKNSCDLIETHYNENMPDLVENFMDYSREDCMNMFTQGQANHMRNVLYGPRVGLIEGASANEEISENLSVAVFPNPASSFVKIQTTSPVLSKVICRLSDMQGKILHAQTLAPASFNNGYQIDVDQYTSGIYILEILSGGMYESVKIMIH